MEVIKVLCAKVDHVQFLMSSLVIANKASSSVLRKNLKHKAFPINEQDFKGCVLYLRIIYRIVNLYQEEALAFVILFTEIFIDDKLSNERVKKLTSKWTSLFTRSGQMRNLIHLIMILFGGNNWLSRNGTINKNAMKESPLLVMTVAVDKGFTYGAHLISSYPNTLAYDTAWSEIYHELHEEEHEVFDYLITLWLCSSNRELCQDTTNTANLEAVTKTRIKVFKTFVRGYFILLNEFKQIDFDFNDILCETDSERSDLVITKANCLSTQRHVTTFLTSLLNKTLSLAPSKKLNPTTHSQISTGHIISYDLIENLRKEFSSFETFGQEPERIFEPKKAPEECINTDSSIHMKTKILLDDQTEENDTTLTPRAASLMIIERELNDGIQSDEEAIDRSIDSIEDDCSIIPNCGVSDNDPLVSQVLQGIEDCFSNHYNRDAERYAQLRNDYISNHSRIQDCVNNSTHVILRENQNIRIMQETILTLVKKDMEFKYPDSGICPMLDFFTTNKCPIDLTIHLVSREEIKCAVIENYQLKLSEFEKGPNIKSKFKFIEKVYNNWKLKQILTSANHDQQQFDTVEKLDLDTQLNNIHSLLTEMKNTNVGANFESNSTKDQIDSIYHTLLSEGKSVQPSPQTKEFLSKSQDVDKKLTTTMTSDVIEFRQRKDSF